MKNAVKVDTLAIFDASLLTGTYEAVNPLGFIDPAVSIRILNDTYLPIFISYDGVNDHDYLSHKESMELNLQTNNAPNNHVSMFKKGTVIWVRDASGSKGGGTDFIYLTVFCLET
jgi:hypothetical protein